MRIEFVNHASLFVDTGSVKLLCDPWIEGRVFEEGWDLVAPTKFSYEDFSRVTHLWFSHEHPDHFFPSNLKQISEEHREKIHVLFQTTADKKVVRYCSGLGFAKVTELPAGEWVSLGDSVEVLNRPLATQWDADSWLCIRTPNEVLLNINDCGVDTEEAHAIQKEVGRVDLLATQFSYAEWQGNAEDREHRRAEARGILERVKRQIEVFQPKWVIPFASFSWFCAEDNFFLNAEMNRPRDAARAIEQAGAKPIVMYPGDRWTLGDDYDSSDALARFEADTEALSQRPLTHRDPVAVDALISAGEEYRQKLLSSAVPSFLSPLLVRMYIAYLEFDTRRRRGQGLVGNLAKLLTCRIKTGQVYLTDHERSFAFDLAEGLRPSECPRSECDVILSSASLMTCFRLPWGGETLLVNGCFQIGTGPDSHWDHLMNYFKPIRRADLGRRLTPGTFVEFATRPARDGV